MTPIEINDWFEGGHDASMRQNIERLVESTADWDVASRFLILFSRFEYALKISGFLQKKEYAEPNWDAFAKSIRDLRLSSAVHVKESVELLIRDPPKKQIVENGRLCWVVSRPDCSNNVGIFVLVRRVRNNLFHGGKFPFDASRDTALLNAAEEILFEGLRQSGNLREVFFERNIHLTL